MPLTLFQGLRCLCEASVSTETTQADAHAWLSFQNEDQGWAQGAPSAAGARTPSVDREQDPFRAQAKVTDWMWGEPLAQFTAR